MKAKDLSLEDLKNYKEWCTVGDLLKFIEDHNISKDSKILVERVEDFYYEKNGWETVKAQVFKERGEYQLWYRSRAVQGVGSGGSEAVLQGTYLHLRSPNGAVRLSRAH